LGRSLEGGFAFAAGHVDAGSDLPASYLVFYAVAELAGFALYRWALEHDHAHTAVDHARRWAALLELADRDLAWPGGGRNAAERGEMLRLDGALVVCPTDALVTHADQPCAC
jgi:hypothetical protein